MRTSKLGEVVRTHESDILQDWVKEQLAASTLPPDLQSEGELREQSRSLLAAIRDALGRNEPDITAPVWSGARDVLAAISHARARQGFSASETATFVFSLKTPLFARLRQAYGRDTDGLAEDTAAVSVLLDRLGLHTVELFLKGRDALIDRQQQEMMELSTPVVELWDGILALPLIGTLDSARTQVVMENLLEKIVQTGAGIAIVDITGVPTVDTQVAQHLLKTVAAARLMGADCIISGIRPQIAQTIVHLGVELGNVVTKATLADAFQVALAKTGASIARGSAAR
jgi:rsbT co-antagonist protein RsbR